MGRSVVLDTGKVQIVLLSRHIEPTAQEMLQVLGIDPSRKQYVAIKSRVHWRADLGKIAREIVECAGVGVCTSDYGQLTFRKVRRPVNYRRFGNAAEAVRFAHVIPEELDGPLALAFHLPGDAVPLRAAGRAVEEVVGEGEDEHAERKAIVFVDLDEASRARITNYVHERLGLS